MREILFRGKRKYGGDWVEGFYYVQRGKYAGDKTFIYEEPKITTGIVETSGAYGETHKDIEYTVIPETVGQYTGLTDKNGKKIFEGDVVRYMNKDIMVVVWYEGSASFVIAYSAINFDYLASIMSAHLFLEVIGNIHDNPELLKGGEE
ncbi:MAG: hypothetical protein J6V42_06080 [Clostridia bacterium]|nr:hypothetical protein [Clostridia bacterium]